MTKYIISFFLSILGLVGLNRSFCQQTDEYEPIEVAGHTFLRVGDVVPEILLPKIFDPVTGKIKKEKLSDYRGKIVVLDFWATWCGPCLKGLPKLSRLQQIFRKHLKIIPVTNEPESIVRKFLTRQSYLINSVIADNSTALYLSKLFPHNTIPHCVIISAEGKVAGITSSAHVDSTLIAELIQQKTPVIPLKDHVAGFKFNTPLLSTGYPNVILPRLSYSMIAGRINGLPAFANAVEKDGVTIGFHLVNLNLSKLFLYVYQLPDWYDRSRVVLENVRDSSVYIHNLYMSERALEEWNDRNTYTYEMVEEGISPKERRIIMKDELEGHFRRLFGTVVYPAEREISCYLLTLADSSRLVKTKGGPSMIGSVPAEKKSFYNNLSMAEFAEAMEKKLFIPVVDATGSSERIDISIPHELTSNARKKENLKLLQDYFRQHGLSLQPSTRKLRVLLITEEPHHFTGM